MINDTKIKALQKKIKDWNANLELFEQQFVIIPYLASGYIDYSNFGQVDGQYTIDNFETYKRVWTGNDSFIITWKDSVGFYNDETNQKIVKEYKIGDLLLGWLENYSGANDIATDQSFDYYKSQTSEQYLTFRINAGEFSLNTNYEFMFYKIPELSGDVLYRVESLDREYVGKDLMCYVLRLKALNQDLANTGQAKQQNVMPNSPGQGYYAPLVVKDYQPEKTDVDGINYKQFYGRYIIIDKQKTLNRPIKKVVVKAFGMCLFSNIALWGRRAVYGGNFKEFGVPRWIFPINITNASTPTVYRAQNAETNYYWIKNGKPMIVNNKETFGAIKDLFQTANFWNSQGFLSVDTDQVKKTNPDTDGTTYSYQLYGRNVISGSKPQYEPWKIQMDRKEYRTDSVPGCQQTYVQEGSKAIHNLMFDAFWIQKNIVALPITPRNTMSFGWTLGASYAASVARNFYTAATIMGIGIIGTLVNKLVRPEFQGISGIIPAALFDVMSAETDGIYSNIANGILGKNQIGLKYFINYDQENDIAKYFNTKTMNTAFEADLTDLIQSDRLVKRPSQTTCIGQKTWDDGSPVAQNKDYFLLNGDSVLVEMDDDAKDTGFIIDAFNIQAMFMGDYSIEFLDRDGDVVWSGIYQSQGKWTGSVREINTWINTSIYGRENLFVGEPLQWPKELPEPHLIGYDQLEAIYLEYGEKERGFERRFWAPSNEGGVKGQTLREVFQNADQLGFTWQYNSSDNKTYYIKNVADRSPMRYTDTHIVGNNVILDAHEWAQFYDTITIEFDTYNMSKTKGRGTLTINLNNGIKVGNTFVASGHFSSDCGSKGVIGDIYNPDNNPGLICIWTQYTTGFYYWRDAIVQRDVKIVFSKNELNQIIMELRVIPSENYESQFRMYAYSPTTSISQVIDVNVDGFLGNIPADTSQQRPLGNRFQSWTYFGIYVRKIKLTPKIISTK